MAPWRVAIVLRAHAVIEFAGGCLERRDLGVGDRLHVAPGQQEIVGAELGTAPDSSVSAA